MARKITFLRGNEGLVAQAVVTGFDPVGEADTEMLSALEQAVEDGVSVFVFADDIEVAFV